MPGRAQASADPGFAADLAGDRAGHDESADFATCGEGQETVGAVARPGKLGGHKRLVRTVDAAGELKLDDVDVHGSAPFPGAIPLMRLQHRTAEQYVYPKFEREREDSGSGAWGMSGCQVCNWSRMPASRRRHESSGPSITSSQPSA